jgi:purine nucleosidase
MELIVDTDCGVDDATSIILALNTHKSLLNKIHAITTVRGNVPAPAATEAARLIIGVCNRPPYPPLYEGATSPLISSYYKEVATWAGHAEDGLGGFSDSEEFKSVYKGFADRVNVDKTVIAAVRIVKLVQGNPPGFFTIVALGPLTNIALAVTLFPGLFQRLKSIWMMGGSTHSKGNSGLASEVHHVITVSLISITIQRPRILF